MCGLVTVAERKARSRARIVAAAAKIARSKGFAGAGVDRVMAAAGLTHGGFYAHFRDKWSLMAEALRSAFDEAEQNLLGGLDGMEGEEVLRAASERYLSVSHVEHPQAGCAIPSLGGEIARAPRGVRAAFRERFLRLVDAHVARFGGDPAAARRRVLVTFASWTGALLLARAVDDASTRDEILGGRARRARARPDRRKHLGPLRLTACTSCSSWTRPRPWPSTRTRRSR